jgi:hypothetical protein
MQSVAGPDDIDAVDGGLADDGDGESDYGQIDQALAAKIMEDLERECAVALNQQEGDGIEEEQEEEEKEEEEEEKEEEEEEKEEEEKEEEEEHERMELEK